jgi:hypothetical protein
MATLHPKESLTPWSLRGATILVPVFHPTGIPPLASVVNGEIPVTVGGWAIGAHPTAEYASINPVVELYLIIPFAAVAGL